MKFFQLVIIIGFTISHLIATFDLNNHHLLFIADNLRKEECLKLLEMLKVNNDNDKADIANEFNFFMKQNKREKPEITSTSTVTTIVTNNVEQKTCYEKLQNWNDQDGYKKTYHHLKRQLEMLNRYDVAAKLGESVNAEVVNDLKYFLFDRFHLNKNSVPEPSDANHKEDQSKPVLDENDFGKIFAGLPISDLSTSFHDYFKKFIFISMIFIISISVLILCIVACIMIIRSRFKK